jgi:hypothetical protein
LLHGLTNIKVGHYLFDTTQNWIKLVYTVKLFHKSSHAGLGECASPENIYGVVSNLVGAPCGELFQ